jgi:hypothetical protein
VNISHTRFDWVAANPKATYARSEAQIQILVDALLNLSAPAVALNDRLLKLESQIERDKAQLEDSQAQLIEAENKNRDLTDQAIVFAALSATKDLATRARLRQEKTFRITVEHEGEHTSEQLLSGKDRKFYTFKIPQMWLSGTHAKFAIKVQQHVLDKFPQLLESQYLYLRVGQSENIKPTYWDIRLDRIDGLRAKFSLLYRDELLPEKKVEG